MKIDWSFPRQIGLTLIIAVVAGVYPLVKYGTREVFIAAVAGLFIATVNVLAGFVAIEYSFNKSATTFLKVVLGGMGIRMFVMAGLIVLLIKVFAMHLVGLIVSLGSFYIIYLTLEILFIQKRFTHRQES